MLQHKQYSLRSRPNSSGAPKGVKSGVPGPKFGRTQRVAFKVPQEWYAGDESAPQTELEKPSLKRVEEPISDWADEPVGTLVGRFKKKSPHDSHGRVNIFGLPGFAPGRLRTHLRYCVYGAIKQAGFNYASIRFEPTYCYDVDPTLGSTAMPGFTELGGLYRFYRTIASTIDVVTTPLDTLAFSVIVTPVNYDPGANHSTSVTQSFQSNPLAKIGVVGPVGTTGLRLKNRITTAEFGGAWDENVIDVYCAQTSGAAAPSNNYFWDIALLSISTMTQGVAMSILMDIEIEFFELNNPAS